MKLVQEITDDNNNLAPTSIGIMRWEGGRLGCAGPYADAEYL
jgi:hypothetical protein